MTERNNDCNEKWAILEFSGCSYRLKEDLLSREDAETLAKGKYRSRDVIITVSSGDISARIAGLNRMASA